MTAVLWTAQSPSNPKTGSVPTAYIGATRYGALASCEGCSLLNAGCYAWSGGARMAMIRIHRLFLAGRDYSFKRAMRDRLPTARVARLASIGDPAILGARVIAATARELRRHNLRLLAYTHFWKRRGSRRPVTSSARQHAMASCDSLIEADQAITAGWKAAAIADVDAPVAITPLGRRLLRCPAVTTHNATTCNDCGLCAPQELRRYDGVFFLPHGRQKASAKRRSALTV